MKIINQFLPSKGILTRKSSDTANRSIIRPPTNSYIFFAVIKQRILTDVEKKFSTAQLLWKQLHYEVGKYVIRALLDSKELSFTTFMEFFNSYEEASKVLETNIFAYHSEKNTVSFQSQSVKSYIQEKADIFIE